MAVTVSIRVRVLFRSRPIYRHCIVFQLAVATRRSDVIDIFVNICRVDGIWQIDYDDPREEDSIDPDDANV